MDPYQLPSNCVRTREWFNQPNIGFKSLLFSNKQKYLEQVGTLHYMAGSTTRKNIGSIESLKQKMHQAFYAPFNFLRHSGKKTSCFSFLFNNIAELVAPIRKPLYRSLRLPALTLRCAVKLNLGIFSICLRVNLPSHLDIEQNISFQDGH